MWSGQKFRFAKNARLFGIGPEFINSKKTEMKKMTIIGTDK